MKAALTLMIVAVAAGCVAAQGSGDDVTLTTLARGPYAASRGERKAVLATSESEYRRLWSGLIGGGEAPPADFANGVVVFLLAGERRTGGWTIEPNSVAVEGDTAVIDADVRGPAADAIVTQAFTYPYAVVAVGSRDVKNVRWPQ